MKSSERKRPMRAQFCEQEQLNIRLNMKLFQNYVVDDML